MTGGGGEASGSMAIHDDGAGPAVLWLHAFPLHASQWDQQVRAVQHRYRCLRPDLWGCGASPPPPRGQASTVDGIAAAILDALDVRGVDRFAVVGLSMGGYLAFALLRRAPSRIGALLLADTRASPDSAAARDDRLQMVERLSREGAGFIPDLMLERLLSPGSRRRVQLAAAVRRTMAGCTAPGITFCQQAMAARPDSSPLLAAINVPTLVVGGRDDILTPPSEVAGLAAAIPGAKHEIIEGAGHLSNLEAAVAFTELAAAFLGRAGDSATPDGWRPL